MRDYKCPIFDNQRLNHAQGLTAEGNGGGEGSGDITGGVGGVHAPGGLLSLS